MPFNSIISSLVLLFSEFGAEKQRKRKKKKPYHDHDFLSKLNKSNVTKLGYSTLKRVFRVMTQPIKKLRSSSTVVKGENKY